MAALKFEQQHIVIEGPIGVGKSSLSRKIVSQFGGTLFLEKPSDNPFLEKFYRSKNQYALAAQLSFLAQRVEQMRELARLKSNQEKPLVSDFMLEKDPIFAALTLNTEELALYKQLFSNMNIVPTNVDLVIYLQAPVRVLQQRIRHRNIKFEQKIPDDYLDRLSTAYTDFFHRYTDSALLIVNAAQFNPLDNEQHFDALMEQISKIKAGKHFFNPLVA